MSMSTTSLDAYKQVNDQAMQLIRENIVEISAEAALTAQGGAAADVMHLSQACLNLSQAYAALEASNRTNRLVQTPLFPEDGNG